MPLHLTEIERVKTISKEDFYTNYVKTKAIGHRKADRRLAGIRKMEA